MSGEGFSDLGKRLAEARELRIASQLKKISNALSDKDKKITPLNKAKLERFKVLLEEKKDVVGTEATELDFIVGAPGVDFDVNVSIKASLNRGRSTNVGAGLSHALEHRHETSYEKKDEIVNDADTIYTRDVRSGALSILAGKGYSTAEAETILKKSLDLAYKHEGVEQFSRIIENLKQYPPKEKVTKVASTEKTAKRNLQQAAQMGDGGFGGETGSRQMEGSIPDEGPDKNSSAPQERQKRKFTQAQQIDNFLDLTKEHRSKMGLSHSEAFENIAGYREARNEIRKIKGRLKKIGTNKETPKTKEEIQNLRDELAKQIRVFSRAVGEKNNEKLESSIVSTAVDTSAEKIEEIRLRYENASDLNEKINAATELAQADAKDLTLTFASFQSPDARGQEQSVLAQKSVSEKLRVLINTLGSEGVTDEIVEKTIDQWQAFVLTSNNLVAEHNKKYQESGNTLAEFIPQLRVHLGLDELKIQELKEASKTSDTELDFKTYNQADDVVKNQHDTAKQQIENSTNLNDDQKNALLASLNIARVEYAKMLSGKEDAPATGKDLSSALETWQNKLSVISKDEQTSPEKRLYENKRTEWLEAKRALQEAGKNYFGEDNKKEQKRIAQELYDKSKIAGIPYLGMWFNRKRRKELQLEQGENQKAYESYTLAQQKYAQALKEALTMRTAYRDENKKGFDVIKAKLGARFFAKEGDEQFPVFVKEGDNGFRVEKSYLVNELAFNKEILPERKKNLFGKIMSKYQQMPYKTKIMIGGAFAGAAGFVTGGSALAGAALLRFALSSTVGAATARFVSGTIMKAGEPALQRQAESVRKTRKESIDTFDPSLFFASKELMQKTESTLRKKEAGTKIIAASAGMGAAYIFGQGASEGIAQYQASLASVPSQTTVPSWEQTGRGLPPNVVEMPSLNGGTPEFTGRQPNVGKLSDMFPDSSPKTGIDVTNPVRPNVSTEVPPGTGSSAFENNTGVTTSPEALNNGNHIAPNPASPSLSEALPAKPPLGMYAVEKGDNFWDIMEGQTHAQQPYSLRGLSFDDQQVRIDLTRDYLNANPDVAREIGFKVDGNVGRIYPEDTIDMDLLNRVTDEVAERHGLLVGDGMSGVSSEVIRPLPRPSDLTATAQAPETSPVPKPRPSFAPETSIRPEPRPSLAPEVSPRPLSRPEQVLPDTQLQPPKFRSNPTITAFNPERTA